MNTTNIFNNSIFSYDDYFTNTLSIIQGSIYIPIFCAGIANNFLTILIISLNRDMRTVTNYYLLNLAISDTLPLIVSLPFEISFLPLEVPWGHLGCQLRGLLAETSTNASILTISAFTIERYLAVCRPHRSSSLSTTRRAIKALIIIWFIAILSSTPYFYFTRKIHDHCAFNPNYRLFVIICIHISATFFFVLPVFILCLLYALMGQRLYNVGLSHQMYWSKNQDLQHIGFIDQNLEEKLHETRHLSSPELMLSRQSIFRKSSGLSLHVQSMKKSAFKMLFAVVIAFIICYAPFHIQRLITSRLNISHLSLIQKRAITIFYFISGIFYYFGSTVNPIFYHLFSRKYRLACIRTMKRIVHCKRHRSNVYQRNFFRNDRVQLRPSYPPYPRLKTHDNIYRTSARHKTNIETGKNKRHLLRFSLPVFSPQ